MDKADLDNRRLTARDNEQIERLSRGGRENCGCVRHEISSRG